MCSGFRRQHTKALRVGMQWMCEVDSVSRMMKEAEKKMYMDKERYYVETGKRR